MAEFEQLLSTLDEQGKAFEAFKEANNSRIEALEKGHGVAEITEKVDKIQAAMLKNSESIKNLENEIARQKTPLFGHKTENSKNEAQKFFKMICGTQADYIAAQTQFKNVVQTTDDSDGGFAVLDNIDRIIGESLIKDSVMLKLCRVAPFLRNYKKEVTISNGALAHAVEAADNATVNDSPQLGQMAASEGKLISIQKITQEAREDMFFDPEGWVRENIAQLFGDTIEHDVLVGAGASGVAKGVLAYDTFEGDHTVTNFGKLRTIKSGASGDFATTAPLDVLKDMRYALKSSYRRNAAWIMSSDVALKIQKMKDSDGQYLWTPQLTAGENEILFGLPVHISDEMPALAADSLSLILGDWKRACRIGLGGSTYIRRDDSAAFPDVILKFSRRYDLTLTEPRALVALKFAAAA